MTLDEIRSVMAGIEVERIDVPATADRRRNPVPMIQFTLIDGPYIARLLLPEVEAMALDQAGLVIHREQLAEKIRLMAGWPRS